MAGGQLIVKMHKIKLKGLVDLLPEKVTVDITDIKIGSSIKIRDLDFENIVLTDPPNAVIVRVKMSRNVTEDEEDEDAEGEEGEEGAEAAPAAE